MAEPHKTLAPSTLGIFEEGLEQELIPDAQREAGKPISNPRRTKAGGCRRHPMMMVAIRGTWNARAFKTDGRYRAHKIDVVVVYKLIGSAGRFRPCAAHSNSNNMTSLSFQ